MKQAFLEAAKLKYSITVDSNFVFLVEEKQKLMLSVIIQDEWGFCRVEHQMTPRQFTEARIYKMIKEVTAELEFSANPDNDRWK